MKNYLEKKSSVFLLDENLVKSPNDSTRDDRGISNIYLDVVNRDLHQPSIEELANYFGLDLEDIIN